MAKTTSRLSSFTKPDDLKSFDVNITTEELVSFLKSLAEAIRGNGELLPGIKIYLPENDKNNSQIVVSTSDTLLERGVKLENELYYSDIVRLISDSMRWLIANATSPVVLESAEQYHYLNNNPNALVEAWGQTSYGGELLVSEKEIWKNHRADIPELLNNTLLLVHQEIVHRNSKSDKGESELEENGSLDESTSEQDNQSGATGSQPIIANEGTAGAGGDQENTTHDPEKDLDFEKKNRIKYEAGWLYSYAIHNLFASRGISSEFLLQYPEVGDLILEEAIKTLELYQVSDLQLLFANPKFRLELVRRMYDQLQRSPQFNSISQIIFADFNKTLDKDGEHETTEAKTQVESQPSDGLVSPEQALHQKLSEVIGQDSPEIIGVVGEQFRQGTAQINIDALIINHGVNAGLIELYETSANTHDAVWLIRNINPQFLTLALGIPPNIQLSPEDIKELRQIVINYIILRASYLQEQAKSSGVLSGISEINKEQADAILSNDADTVRSLVFVPQQNVASLVADQNKTGDGGSKVAQSLYLSEKETEAKRHALWNSLPKESQESIYNFLKKEFDPNRSKSEPLEPPIEADLKRLQILIADVKRDEHKLKEIVDRQHVGQADFTSASSDEDSRLIVQNYDSDHGQLQIRTAIENYYFLQEVKNNEYLNSFILADFEVQEVLHLKKEILNQYVSTLSESSISSIALTLGFEIPSEPGMDEQQVFLLQKSYLKEQSVSNVVGAHKLLVAGKEQGVGSTKIVGAPKSVNVQPNALLQKSIGGAREKIAEEAKKKLATATLNKMVSKLGPWGALASILMDKKKRRLLLGGAGVVGYLAAKGIAAIISSVKALLVGVGTGLAVGAGLVVLGAVAWPIALGIGIVSGLAAAGLYSAVGGLGSAGSTLSTSTMSSASSLGMSQVPQATGASTTATAPSLSSATNVTSVANQSLQTGASATTTTGAATAGTGATTAAATGVVSGTAAAVTTAGATTTAAALPIITAIAVIPLLSVLMVALTSLVVFYVIFGAFIINLPGGFSNKTYSSSLLGFEGCWPTTGKIISYKSYMPGGVPGDDHATMKNGYLGYGGPGIALDISTSGNTAEEGGYNPPIFSPFSGVATFYPDGTGIRSDKPGAKHKYPYGNYVLLDTGDFLIIFGHMLSFPDQSIQFPVEGSNQLVSISPTTVTKKVKIRAGDLIGIVNSTGNSDGNHLHYEIIGNGLDILDITPLTSAEKQKFKKDEQSIWGYKVNSMECANSGPQPSTQPGAEPSNSN